MTEIFKKSFAEIPETVTKILKKIRDIFLKKFQDKSKQKILNKWLINFLWKFSVESI